MACSKGKVVSITYKGRTCSMGRVGNMKYREEGQGVQQRKNDEKSIKCKSRVCSKGRKGLGLHQKGVVVSIECQLEV